MKRSRHLRNSSQNKFIELLPNTETYKNSYFAELSKTGMHYQAKLLILSPQIVSKKCYLSILVIMNFNIA